MLGGFDLAADSPGQPPGTVLGSVRTTPGIANKLTVTERRGQSPLPAIFAQVSRSVMVRLNTGRSRALSLVSTQK